MKRRSLAWHLTHLVHNCVAHPLLPVAELLIERGCKVLPEMIFRFHDLTAPGDDAYNKKLFF